MINELPQPVQNYFNEVKSNIQGKSETRANQIAWTITKSKFNKIENNYVAKTSDFDTIKVVHYEFVPSEVTISKDDDGDEVIDFILMSNDIDNQGKNFDDFAIKRIVEQINEEGLIGRIDGNFRHETYDALVRAGRTPSEIEEELQSLDTGIKAISARFDNGKLVAKIKVNPKLTNDILKFKGASIEARVPSESIVGNTYKQARAVGFVFTNNPSNPYTGLAL
jgi:hypothetical protein